MRNGRRICRRCAGSREAREQAEPEDPYGDGSPESGSAEGGPAEDGSEEVETLAGTRFLSTAPRMPLTDRVESASSSVMASSSAALLARLPGASSRFGSS